MKGTEKPREQNRKEKNEWCKKSSESRLAIESVVLLHARYISKVQHGFPSKQLSVDSIALL